MSTVEVATTRRALLRFLELPQRVYAEDPNWVAPVRAVIGARLLRTGFTDPDRLFRLLMVHRDGQVVGRCAVFRDRAHDAHKDENVCFFGYFEAIDDDAGVAVLDAARNQAQQWGAQMLRGPRGITRIDKRGLLIEGHHLAPFLAGHHPVRYRALFEDQGFVKHHDALAYEIDLLDEAGAPRPIPDQLAAKADAVDIPGLDVRPAAWNHVFRDLDLAHTVMVEGFRDVPDNTPIPRSTFRGIGLPFLAVTHREMLQLATVNGRAAGFALCVPELNEALVHAEGRAGPRGWAGALLGRSTMRTASFKLLSVLPEFRGTGLHALLIREACYGVQRAGYSRLEASLIDARNKPMRKVVESAGMTIYRRYRVYERPV